MLRIRHVAACKTLFQISGNTTNNFLRDLRRLHSGSGSISVDAVGVHCSLSASLLSHGHGHGHIRTQPKDRTSSTHAHAAATMPTKVTPEISRVKTPAPAPAPAPLQRLAARADIADIKACNLRNLPENYTPAFFERHVSMWPELSLVSHSREGAFAGYALGRLEEAPRPVSISIPAAAVTRAASSGVANTNTSAGSGSGSFYNTLNSGFPAPVYVGHITSVAVHEEFRGMGVASKLMQALHAQMRRHHKVDVVQLHVRVSNVAAIALYEKSFGYKIAQHIPDYYADMEAAYLMQLDGLKA